MCGGEICAVRIYVWWGYMCDEDICAMGEICAVRIYVR